MSDRHGGLSRSVALAASKNKWLHKIISFEYSILGCKLLKSEGHAGPPGHLTLLKLHHCTNLQSLTVPVEKLKKATVDVLYDICTNVIYIFFSQIILLMRILF